MQSGNTREIEEFNRFYRELAQNMSSITDQEELSKKVDKAVSQKVINYTQQIKSMSQYTSSEQFNSMSQYNFPSSVSNTKINEFPQFQVIPAEGTDRLQGNYNLKDVSKIAPDKNKLRYKKEGNDYTLSLNKNVKTVAKVEDGRFSIDENALKNAGFSGVIRIPRNMDAGQRQ